MTEEIDTGSEAYEVGLSHGWDHANFVDAYGKEHDRRTPAVPSCYQEITYGSAMYWSLTAAERGAEDNKRRTQHREFTAGWSEGKKRFRYGKYPDGTKIPD